MQSQFGVWSPRFHEARREAPMSYQLPPYFLLLRATRGLGRESQLKRDFKASRNLAAQSPNPFHSSYGYLSMHRVLRIHEILAVIFQNCVWDVIDDLQLEIPGSRDLFPAREGREKPSSRCLSWFAGATTTCQAFYEPAMDTLWQDLSDISPLFKCLPKDLWTEDSDCDPNYMLKRVSTFVSIQKLSCSVPQSSLYTIGPHSTSCAI